MKESVLYLLLFAIIAYTFTCGLIVRGRSILLNLSLGIGSFCSVYAIVSALMFWVDRFSIIGAVIITVAVAAIADVVLSIRGRRFEWKWPGVTAAVPVGLLLILVPLMLNQFDMYGMGQDEGVYQTKAIALMMGHTSNKYDFDEYHDLTEAQQEEYSEWLDIFTGFYNDPIYPGFYEQDQHCAGEGYFHGIPNVAALMALSGLAFGIGGMKYIFLLLYIATAFIIWETCNELGWRRGTGWIVSGLFILSPIVLWVTKSSLTESLLTCVVTLLIYIGLLAWKGELNPFFMLLPIGTFCFYHVSAFMLMPLFNAILLLMYWEKRDRRFWIANEVSLAVFAAGFIMMLQIAPEYSYRNLAKIEILGLTHSTLWVVAPAYFILMSIISVAVLLIKKVELRKIFESRVFAWILRALIIVSLCYVGYTVYKLHLGGEVNFINRPFFGSDNYWEIFTYTTLFANCMMGGLLLLPATIGGLIGKPWRFLKGYGLYITGIFVYIALLCNVFVNSTVSYYYYYDRYLEYVVPVSVLMGGLFMERLSRRAGYALGVVSAAVMIPFSAYILTNDDDSIITNDVLEDLNESIEEDSAIIFECSDDVTRVLAIDLRELTGAKVYPVFTDYETEKSDLLAQYSHVYILSDTGMFEDGKVTGVYRNMESNYVPWPDTKWCPLPMASTINESMLYLYELGTDDCVIDLMGRMFFSENAEYIQENSYELENAGYYEVSENGILYGPYFNLYSGDYELIYDAELPEGAELTLNITAESGQEILGSYTIVDGKNVIDFTLDVSEKQVEFVVCAGDKTFCVTGIWLERIADNEWVGWK